MIPPNVKIGFWVFILLICVIFIILFAAAPQVLTGVKKADSTKCYKATRNMGVSFMSIITVMLIARMITSLKPSHKLPFSRPNWKLPTSRLASFAQRYSPPPPM